MGLVQHVMHTGGSRSNRLNRFRLGNTTAAQARRNTANNITGAPPNASTNELETDREAEEESRMGKWMDEWIVENSQEKEDTPGQQRNAVEKDEELERDKKRLEKRRKEKEEEQKEQQTSETQEEEQLRPKERVWLEDYKCYIDELDTGGETPIQIEALTDTEEDRHTEAEITRGFEEIFGPDDEDGTPEQGIHKRKYPWKTNRKTDLEEEEQRTADRIMEWEEWKKTREEEQEEIRRLAEEEWNKGREKREKRREKLKKRAEDNARWTWETDETEYENMVQRNYREQQTEEQRRGEEEEKKAAEETNEPQTQAQAHNTTPPVQAQQTTSRRIITTLDQEEIDNQLDEADLDEDEM